jgi:diacylglycerol O-acyltransferase/trehalose O-mycolyltransferase
MAAGLLGGAVAGAAPGVAAQSPSILAQAPNLERHMVPSAAMGRSIPVDILRGSGNGALYLLDGLRANDQRSGWDIETNVRELFAGTSVNVVMPVGGRSSFYADWINDPAPNLKYEWETFLTSELPGYLSGVGIRSTNNAIAGLSMAGSAALKLAADHPGRFKYAASFSGYLNLSAPGMPEAVSLALRDEGGFNAVDMFGPLGGPGWVAHDPTRQVEKLRGTQLYISAGSGIPGQHTRLNAPADYFNTVNAMGLEWIALMNTRTFERAARAAGVNATYSYPAQGVHAWGYWQDELTKAKPQILAAIG